MKIPRRKRRVLKAAPWASMGDIAFLLIIFFMLASKFAKEQHIKLEKPVASALEEMDKSPVSVSVDQDGQLWVDGQSCTIEELRSRIEGLIDTTEDKTVLVKADRHLLRDKYEQVFIELSHAGARIAIVGLEE